MKELKSVFHVDDDEDILELARMSLEIVGGLDVHQCNSGDQAIQEVTGQTPDLILLDVMMPDTDGPSLLRRIRETYPDEFSETPAVFMTAKSEQTVDLSRAGPHVIGVVAKPFDPMSLAEKLQRLLNGERDG